VGYLGYPLWSPLAAIRAVAERRQIAEEWPTEGITKKEKIWI
jgi:hypothetical protein